MLAPLIGAASSLVGLRGRRLELLRDAVHVARVLQEVLEDLELALADRGPEGGRLEIREVEARRLRLLERLCDRALGRVGIGAERHVLVERAETPALGPDLGRLRRREV